MFRNIGGKLRVLAIVIFCIGAVTGVLFSVDFIAMSGNSRGLNFDALYSALFVLITVLIAWAGSFALYALGEMAENSAAQTKLLKELAEEMREKHEA